MITEKENNMNINTFGIAKVFIVKFCSFAHLTIDMSDIDKAVSEIQAVLDGLIANHS